MLTRPTRFDITAAPELPVEAMLRGKSAEEAAGLMPRLFNLCRGAQEIGARMALGLPVWPTLHDTARQEMIRDHVLKLFIVLPSRLGLQPVALPDGWQDSPSRIMRTAAGPLGLPTRIDDFRAFIEGDVGLAPVLGGIARTFPDRACDTGKLDAATVDTLFTTDGIENSVAGRHADHPLMQGIARHYGHGPLWRTVARLVELTRPYPRPRATAFGTIVAAPRGDYCLRIGMKDGRVTSVLRITPTDHLLARGGILERSLATLPDAGKVPLLLDILDPCSPVTVKEAYHA